MTVTVTAVMQPEDTMKRIKTVTVTVVMQLCRSYHDCDRNNDVDRFEHVHQIVYIGSLESSPAGQPAESAATSACSSLTCSRTTRAQHAKCTSNLLYAVQVACTSKQRACRQLRMHLLSA